MIYVHGNSRFEKSLPSGDPDQVCPVCGGAVVHEKCKVVCRSDTCTYRVILNCSEF
jgi:hypothetical protein